MRTPNRDPLQKRHQRERPGYHRPARVLVESDIALKHALTRFILLAELHGYGEEPSEPRPISAKAILTRAVISRALLTVTRQTRPVFENKNFNLFEDALRLHLISSLDDDRSPELDQAWKAVMALS